MIDDTCIQILSLFCHLSFESFVIVAVGYVYILFESERSVRALLQACTHDFTNGGEYYYKISSRRMRSKEVRELYFSDFGRILFFISSMRATVKTKITQKTKNNPVNSHFTTQHWVGSLLDSQKSVWSGSRDPCNPCGGGAYAPVDSAEIDIRRQERVGIIGWIGAGIYWKLISN